MLRVHARWPAVKTCLFIESNAMVYAYGASQIFSIISQSLSTFSLRIKRRRQRTPIAFHTLTTRTLTRECVLGSWNLWLVRSRPPSTTAMTAECAHLTTKVFRESELIELNTKRAFVLLGGARRNAIMAHKNEIPKLPQKTQLNRRRTMCTLTQLQSSTFSLYKNGRASSASCQATHTLSVSRASLAITKSP